MKKLLAMMVGVAAITASARTAELDWFNVDTTQLTDLSATQWTTKPTSGEAIVNTTTHKIELDTDFSEKLEYTPATTNQPVVTIRAEIQATVNVTMPEASTFNGNQAVLTVATNTTASKLQWVGLVKSGDAAAWQYFDEATPTADQSYQVKIEIDNSGATKLIRYTVGETVLGAGWYENPQTSATTVTAVAFSGTGNVGSFNGKTVQEGGVITPTTQTQGYDFTNGVVKLNLSSPISGAKAYLTYKTADGETVNIPAKGITSTTTEYTFNFSDLVAGGVTTYTIEVKVGDDVYATQHGTFMSANPDAWFKADASTDPATVVNASWETTPEIQNSKYVIDGDSQLNIADGVTNKCANLVSTVDTTLKYTSLIDADSLPEVEDSMLGDFSAVSDNGGKWMAMAGNVWVELAGADAPVTNVDYVIRAELDFRAAGKRIRYSVQKGTDGFVPLTYNGSAWINMIASTKNALETVTVKGSGELASIDGQIADPSIAAVGDVKYATLWEALRASNTVKLLTNATLNGPGAFTGTFTITKNGFQLKSGVFGPDMKATITDNGNTYTVEVEAAPKGAIYLIY